MPLFIPENIGHYIFMIHPVNPQHKQSRIYGIVHYDVVVTTLLIPVVFRVQSSSGSRKLSYGTVRQIFFD